MYEYVGGKVDWMAYGLPVEGEAGPFVGSALVEVPTATIEESPAEVAARLEASGADKAVIVTDRGIVLGTTGAKALAAAGDREGLLDVMELSPSTIRPHVELSALDERAAGVLVTTPDGTLLGAVDPQAIWEQSDEDDPDEFEHEVHDVLEAVEEHFGDEEPGDDELRDFLRDRLVDKGRTREEADRVMAEMQDSTEG